jgi:hypothetical protein
MEKLLVLKWMEARFKGFKAAFGPQLWWGNPAVLLKYATKVGKFDFAAVYHEECCSAVSSICSAT